MNAERWREIEWVYLRACELGATERAAYLDGACGSDADLRAEVERLLATGASPTFLEPPIESNAKHPALDLAGARLGEFELIEEIGRGGMGVVYLARQAGLERLAAVKILPPQVRSDAIAVERFRREAQAASRLRHPGIATVLSLGEEQGLFYYAMEYVDGASLRTLLDDFQRGTHRAEGAVPPLDFDEPKTSARLALQVAEALAYSHEHGVLHRDVKPQNILIERTDRRPRLIDFGLARITELEALSRTGDLMGTPTYMSPEQVRAQSAKVDHRTDVYSIGVVLYEILAGAAPFTGGSFQEILHHITYDEPRPVRRANPRVPRDLAVICAKAMRKEPRNRYPSAAELADDLRRFLEGRPVRAEPPSMASRLRRQLLRRRTLVTLGPVLVGVGVVTQRLLGGRTAKAADEHLPRIAVRLAAAGEVSAARLGRWPDEWAPPTPLRASGDGLYRARLDPGEYRFVARDAGGAFAELRRSLAFEATHEEDARLAHPRAVGEDMRTIAAGTVRIPLLVTDRATGRASVEYRQVSVRSFLIDARVVTNGAYRRFLEATGGQPPASWIASLAPSDREDWDTLPVTSVTWRDAQRFAEWAGKRLPTLPEWERAVGTRADESWLSGDFLAPATTPFNLDKPHYAAWRGRERSSSGAYVAHVRSVQDPLDAGYGPYALHQPFGNVMEWLETPRLFRDGERMAWGFGQRHVQGGAWHTRTDDLRSGSLMPAFRAVDDHSADTGFRCAKSTET